jgi:hypothetical protein
VGALSELRRLLGSAGVDPQRTNGPVSLGVRSVTKSGHSFERQWVCLGFVSRSETTLGASTATYAPRSPYHRSIGGDFRAGWNRPSDSACEHARDRRSRPHRSDKRIASERSAEARAKTPSKSHHRHAQSQSRCGCRAEGRVLQSCKKCLLSNVGAGSFFITTLVPRDRRRRLSCRARRRSR